ncbi:MAG TPA: TRAP transporter large permease subunit [Stellaceae bacterium]
MAAGTRAPSRLDALERLCVALARRIAIVAVVGMLALSLLTTVDVSLRYFFSAPIPGLDEATQLIMAVIVSASLPIGIATRNHIAIDFFRRPIGPQFQAVLEAVGDALILGMMVLLTLRFGAYAERLTLRHDITTIIALPLAPFWWAVTVLLGVCAAMQAIMFLSRFAKALDAGWAGAPLWRGGAIVVPSLVVIAVLYDAILQWGTALGPVALAGLAFVALWIPIAIMIPVGIAMACAGLAGGSVLVGFDPTINSIVLQSAGYLSSLNLVVLPLFLMKGGFATAAGLSTDAYRLAHALFARRRGGLAIATIGSCAAFGAVTGSSLATAATIGTIAVPEMRRRGYSAQLATGCVAAGGTLGSLIPPSGIMVLYAVLTETSINKIFVAAVFPALLAAVLYVLTISVYVRVRPGAAGPVERVPWREVVSASLNSWGVVVLFGAVVGGIYAGVFTATEAGAVGGGFAFLFAWARGRLKGDAFWRVMGDVARNTALIYMLLFGAVAFSFFIGVTQLPQVLVDFIQAADLPPLFVICLLLIIYLLLGFFMDPVTTLFITVPVVMPLITSLGYDPIWWGILTIAAVEVGLIHPPFGLNAFIIKGVAGEDVTIGTIFRGIMPFLAADFVKLALLVAFPLIALWLPGTMR